MTKACGNEPPSRDPLELISLRQLRYFNAAMLAGSFNEAARSCSISQPALSAQIAALEQALGLRLFDRIGRRATPTQPAQQLHRRITASMGDLQAALRTTGEESRSVSGRVRIGLVQSYGGCWVAPVVRAAQMRWPELVVALSRRTVPALSEGVSRGDLDLAVTFDVTAHPEQEIRPCFTEPFVALGAAAHSGAIGLAELARQRLALLPIDYAMRRQIDGQFAAAGLRPSVCLESDALEDLVQAARTGGMVAIVNASTALSLGVRDATPIDAPGLQRRACLLRSSSRYQTRAACHLWDALCEAAADLQDLLETQSHAAPSATAGRRRTIKRR